MIVWTLLVVWLGAREAAPTVIDNIASQADCERVKTAIVQFSHDPVSGYPSAHARCIAIRKARP